jgi:hypothetical protein
MKNSCEPEKIIFTHLIIDEDIYNFLMIQHNLIFNKA